jgi:hypothetical protein
VRYHDPVLAYFARVRSRLGTEPSRLYLLADERSALHEYYLDTPEEGGNQVRLIGDPSEMVVPESQPTFLFAMRDLDRVWETPWLAPLTRLGGTCGDPTREILFRVLPESLRGELNTTADRLNHRLPYRLALLGNTGTRKRAQADVADEMYVECKRGPIDDVVLLGNNIHGPSVFHHLEILESFEYPYRPLLREGVRFHAALGHEDQSYAFLQTRYSVFNMCGERYYKRTLGMGLVDLFVLDSQRLNDHGTIDEEQMAWLERELAASRTPWKVVGLFAAVLTDAAKGNADPALTERLLPLFERYNVDVAASGGSQWYERLEPSDGGTIYLNLGWSGEVRHAEFRQSAQLQAHHDEDPGFFYIDFTPNSMIFRAVDDHGDVVDMGHVGKGRARETTLTQPIEIDLEDFGDDASEN